jgi:beta-lactam-binding protein with PASTA domain
VAAMVLASCNASGDTGIRPPLLSSTVPRPPARRVGSRGQRIAVICVNTGTPTTLPSVVPEVVGLSLPDAVQTLVCQGFRLAIIPRDGSTVGVIVTQKPLGGTPSPSNHIVTLSVSKP